MLLDWVKLDAWDGGLTLVEATCSLELNKVVVSSIINHLQSTPRT